MDKKDLGKRIAELRTQNSFTQLEIAKSLGYKDKSTVASWETGKSSPSIDIFIKLCKLFKVTPNDFLGFSDSQPLTVKEKMLIDSFQQLNASGRDIVEYVMGADILKKNYIAIKCSTLSVCAGNGLELDDEYFEEIEVLDTPESFKATFAVPVKGKSMEPTYPDGSILLVHKQPSIDKGKIGVFSIDNGQAVVKELSDSFLLSHNKNFEPISLDRIEQCFGEVLGVAVLKG